MEVTSVILAISTMGIIIVFGALIALKISITAEMKNILMMIILHLAVPFIILNGVFNTKITDVIFQQVFLVFGISVGFNAGGIILTLVLGRLLHLNQPKQLALLAALGNTGFIGIPLSATLFGPLGGLLAAVFDAGLDVVLFSLGIYLLQSNQKFQFKQLKALLNLPLLAISLGLLYVISGWEAPLIFKQLASMLSNLAAPLAMLYIGFLLPTFFQVGRRFYFQGLWFPLLMKLMILPLFAIICLRFTSLQTDLIFLLIILTSMPTFMLASVLFSRYTKEENEAIMVTIYSTLISILTIPLISWIASFLL